MLCLALTLRSTSSREVPFLLGGAGGAATGVTETDGDGMGGATFGPSVDENGDASGAAEGTDATGAAEGTDATGAAEGVGAASMRVPQRMQKRDPNITLFWHLGHGNDSEDISLRVARGRALLPP